jgi:hypothetical protein
MYSLYPSPLIEGNRRAGAFQLTFWKRSINGSTSALPMTNRTACALELGVGLPVELYDAHQISRPILVMRCF